MLITVFHQRQSKRGAPNLKWHVYKECLWFPTQWPTGEWKNYVELTFLKTEAWATTKGTHFQLSELPMGRRVAKNLASRVRLFRFKSRLHYVSSLHLNAPICKMGVFRVVSDLMPVKSKNRAWSHLGTEKLDIKIWQQWRTGQYTLLFFLCSKDVVPSIFLRLLLDLFRLELYAHSQHQRIEGKITFRWSLPLPACHPNLPWPPRPCLFSAASTSPLSTPRSTRSLSPLPGFPNSMHFHSKPRNTSLFSYNSSFSVNWVLWILLFLRGERKGFPNWKEIKEAMNQMAILKLGDGTISRLKEEWKTAF